MGYLNVILPLRVSGAFTYHYPEDVYPNAVPGCRVIVQFGKQKIYTGIIQEIFDENPSSYDPKSILELIDDSPILAEHQLKFYQWISEYYLCTIGEVVNAALPAGLKISSESLLSINPDIDIDELDLTEKERDLLLQLQYGDLSIQDAGKHLNVKAAQPYIKKLKEKNAIQVFEKVKDKYAPRTERWVTLTDQHRSEEALEELSSSLEAKPKQLEALITYLRLEEDTDPWQADSGLSLAHFLAEGHSRSTLKTLEKKGILHVWDKVVSRLPPINKIDADVRLSPDQNHAKKEILHLFESKSTVLLHGITGSGKTEVYISLIQDILDHGGQVLYMLPEIALTTQIIGRLSKAFGTQFGVFHSKYSDSERVEVWQKVLAKEYSFVVGVRSSVFLPFTDLALIIVDEEHEPSFKQYEPAPRYHARDAAIYLATTHHAKVLLGTATPSLESYYNALDEKYGLVKLDKRYSAVEQPKISFANMLEERKKKKVKGSFSSTMLSELQHILEAGKQAILFQNQRGYAPHVTCYNCGHIPKCPHCDVSLTLHSYQNLLICHYCGHKTERRDTCTQCSSQEMRPTGYGTEKLEEELEQLLPNARIRRMDLDSTRSKYGHQKIINEFESGDIDILVGTQMVSKGLDFDKVMLVGVFEADRMIHFPDFRSHERAYQLIHQVSGRAGRRDKQGLVIIQTNDPHQHVLTQIKHYNYSGFYQKEIMEREQFHYPPFYRMIQITFKDTDQDRAARAATWYARAMSKSLGMGRIIGPTQPIISKIRNQHLYDITLKLEKTGINLKAVKTYLATLGTTMQGQPDFKSVRLIFDVDPI